MRFLTLIAFAILTLTFVTSASSQSGGASGDSSSKISITPPTNIPDDEAFAAYQRVTAGTKPPKATHAPDPAYPEIPKDAEPKGVVVMLVGINAKGRVELVHVLRASNAAFQNSAVSTVKTWKFSPAKKDGRPMPVQVTVEMKFQK